MSHQARDTSRKTSICPRCRALNASHFATCIRCGHAFSTRAHLIQSLESHVDGDDMWGVKSIILLTVIVFAGQVWIGLRGLIQGNHDALEAIDIVFDALLRPTIVDAVRFGALHARLVLHEPWRLVSAVFVHFGSLHLLANMFFLTWLGRVAEPAIGSARFVVAYVVTGIAGFVISTAYSMFVESFGGGLTAGASGAVFGVTGVVLGMLYRQKNPQWKRFAVQAVAFQLLVGLAINQARVGIMINNLAHIGGLIPGLLFGVVFATRAKSSRETSRTEFLLNMSALVGVVVCLATLVLAQRSPAW